MKAYELLKQTRSYVKAQLSADLVCSRYLQNETFAVVIPRCHELTLNNYGQQK